MEIQDTVKCRIEPGVGVCIRDVKFFARRSDCAGNTGTDGHPDFLTSSLRNQRQHFLPFVIHAKGCHALDRHVGAHNLQDDLGQIVESKRRIQQHGRV